jgi:hypothetical protein
MADRASANNVDENAASSTVPADKGKGKSTQDESDVSMMDEDEQSEESEHEAQVSTITPQCSSEYANKSFCRMTMVCAIKLQE